MAPRSASSRLQPFQKLPNRKRHSWDREEEGLARMGSTSIPFADIGIQGPIVPAPLDAAQKKQRESFNRQLPRDEDERLGCC
jgi:hypothetical protein